MGMATVVGVAGIACAGVLGVPLTVAGVLQLRDSLDVRGTDWGDIVDLDGGYGKVHARVTEADETVTAPFSGRDCVAVEAAIERYQTVSSGGAGRNRSWKDDHAVMSAVPFDVDDPTGTVRVEPAGADWSLENDYEQLVAEGEAPTGPHAEFLDEHDVFVFDDQGVSEAHELKFVERRVEPGDEIAVFGPVDDGGVRRQIRADDGWLVSKLFSITDERDEFTQSVGTAAFATLFGLLFLAAGLSFAWAGLT